MATKVKRAKLRCGSIVTIKWDDAPLEKGMVVSLEGSTVNFIPLKKRRDRAGFMPLVVIEAEIDQVVKVEKRLSVFRGY